jgi:hypothetical protein
LTTSINGRASAPVGIRKTIEEIMDGLHFIQHPFSGETTAGAPSEWKALAREQAGAPARARWGAWGAVEVRAFPRAA